MKNFFSAVLFFFLAAVFAAAALVLDPAVEKVIFGYTFHPTTAKLAYYVWLCYHVGFFISILGFAVYIFRFFWLGLVKGQL